MNLTKDLRKCGKTVKDMEGDVWYSCIRDKDHDGDCWY